MRRAALLPHTSRRACPAEARVENCSKPKSRGKLRTRPCRILLKLAGPAQISATPVGGGGGGGLRPLCPRHGRAGPQSRRSEPRSQSSTTRPPPTVTLGQPAPDSRSPKLGPPRGLSFPAGPARAGAWRTRRRAAYLWKETARFSPLPCLLEQFTAAQQITIAGLGRERRQAPILAARPLARPAPRERGDTARDVGRGRAVRQDGCALPPAPRCARAARPRRQRRGRSGR